MAEVCFIRRAGDRSPTLHANGGQLGKLPLLDVAADLAQGLWNFQSAMLASHLSPPLNRRGPGMLYIRPFLPPIFIRASQRPLSIRYSNSCEARLKVIHAICGLA